MSGRPITNPHLRVSDAERTEVAELLKRHCADGRLDSTEFEARLDRALRAKTRADLAGLFDDLPSLEPTRPPVPARRPRGPRSTLWLVAAVAVVAMVTASVVSAAWSFARWRVPWFLVVIVVFVLWRRGHHHHDRRMYY